MLSTSLSIVGIDEAQVDGGVTAIGDDRQQDIVAGLRRAVALLDRLDALAEQGLIALESRRRLGGEDLPRAGGEGRDFDILAQVGRQHHVGEGAEHGDQFGHVDEGGEAAHRLVFARWLQLQLRRGVAEGRRPGVEFVQPALQQRRVAEEALHREHLAERIGDRRAGGEDERPARVFGLDEAGFDIEVPGALRAVRIDALERRHVGGEAEFAELLRLVDDDLVDAHFGDGEQIVLAGGQRLQAFLEPLLQAFEALARHAVVAFDLGQQCLVELQLVLDHLLLERRWHGDEAEGRMGDDDGVPGGGCRPRQEAMPLVLGEIGLVGDENARGRIEGEKLARGLRQAMAGNDQHGLGDQAEPALFHDGGRHGHGLAGADGMGKVGRAGRDDAPDAALLVPIQEKRRLRRPVAADDPR